MGALASAAEETMSAGGGDLAEVGEVMPPDACHHPTADQGGGVAGCAGDMLSSSTASAPTATTSRL
jgi:hypothetical protein